jgi:hypothetical protein
MRSTPHCLTTPPESNLGTCTFGLGGGGIPGSDLMPLVVPLASLGHRLAAALLCLETFGTPGGRVVAHAPTLAAFLTGDVCRGGGRSSRN